MTGRPTACAAVVAAAMVATAACTAPDTSFDPAGARAHVRTLAGTIGARPHGSPAAARAREYIVGRLRALGFQVRIQDEDAVDVRRGVTARVRNVIAWRDGEIEAAVALVSHYDSRPGAPGAIDDALGVATSLEAARLLLEAGLRHSLFVIVTDAEEAGMMGARALVADPEVAGRVGAFLNFEATGGAGPSILFEAGGGSTLTAWARGAAAPVGTSLGIEIYRRMPNDSDFTVLRTLGIDGLNFAPIGDSYAYHTDRDVPDRVRDATLSHGLSNAVTTVRALDAMPLTAGTESVTYFDVGHRVGVVYGSGAAGVVTIAGAVFGALAWLLLAIEGRRHAGLTRLAATAAVATLTAAAFAAGLLAAAWLVPAVRSERMPWYAAPAYHLIFIASTGSIAAWVVARFSRRLPDRVQPWRDPAAVWWVALPTWAVAGGVAHAMAPAASYLITAPLLLAAVVVLVSSRSRLALRAASVVVLVAASLLWVPNVVRLLGFIVPLFGWVPAEAPFWMFPAVLGAAALMLVPPVIALAAGRPPLGRARRTALVLAVPVVVGGAFALAVPAYNEARPERRSLLYVEDVDRGQAWWEIGGREPLSELGEGPDGSGWSAVTADDPELPGTRRFTRLPRTYRHRAPARAGLKPPPALVTADIRPTPEGAAEVRMAIVPRELVTAEIRLPAGLAPIETSLAGRDTPLGWSATHVAVPAGGLSVRLVIARAADAISNLEVALTTASVPGSATPDALPAWLPTARSTWSVRAVHLIDVPLVAAPPGG